MTGADWALLILVAIVVLWGWWYYLVGGKSPASTDMIETRTLDYQFEEVVCSLESSDLSDEQLEALKQAVKSEINDVLIYAECDSQKLLTLIQQCIDVKYRGSEKAFEVTLFIVPTLNKDQAIIIYPRVHSYFSIDLTNWLLSDRVHSRGYLYSVDRGETIFIDGSNRNDELYGKSSAGYAVQISVPDGAAKLIHAYKGTYKAWDHKDLILENTQVLQVDYPWDEAETFGNRNLKIKRPRR